MYSFHGFRDGERRDHSVPVLPLELEARAPVGPECHVLKFLRPSDAIFLDLLVVLTADRPLSNCLEDA